MSQKAGRSPTRVTMADIARSLGVSVSAVSRALGEPGRVSETMRQRVQQAADDLGYRPNLHARSLISGHTRTIALVVPDVTNPYFFDLIRGHQAQSKASGYRNLLLDTEESAEVEAELLADLPVSVDGAIVAASRLTDAQLLQVSKELPLVLVNREIGEIPSVLIDSAVGFCHALDHLASLGHRSVAYIGGPESSWSEPKRWQAVKESAERLGIDAQHLGYFSPGRNAGAAAADAAIHHGSTAAVFFNDLLAIGALQRFITRGIRVPEDISVVGCDDIFGADFCRPPLTTISAPIERAGRVATDILLAAIPSSGSAGRPLRTRETLTPHLTVRLSTGPAPSG